MAVAQIKRPRDLIFYLAYIYVQISRVVYQNIISDGHSHLSLDRLSKHLVQLLLLLSRMVILTLSLCA